MGIVLGFDRPQMVCEAVTMRHQGLRKSNALPPEPGLLIVRGVQGSLEGSRKARVCWIGRCPDLQGECQLGASEARGPGLALYLAKEAIGPIRLAGFKSEASGREP